MTEAEVQKKLGKRLDPTASSPFVARTVEDAGYYKIAAFGPPGSGKSSIIITLLKLGFKVFDADTDFGGNGLRTVYEALRKAGRMDLLKNLTYFEFSDMVINNKKVTGKDLFEKWLNDPAQMVVSVDGASMPLWDWNPDWLAWEGFSNFQQSMIEPEVLSMEANSNSDKTSEMRQAGLIAEQRDWDAIKRVTLWSLDKFLRIHNPVTGKRLHKLVTAHQGTPKEDKVTGETTKGPLIQGAARNLFGAGFDLVLNTARLSNIKDEAEYYYYVQHADRDVKKRGVDVGEVKKGRIPADFDKLWEKMTGQVVPAL